MLTLLPNEKIEKKDEGPKFTETDAAGVDSLGPDGSAGAHLQSRHVQSVGDS